jgi:hypothetical protein
MRLRVVDLIVPVRDIAHTVVCVRVRVRARVCVRVCAGESALDVLVLAPSIISFESVLKAIPSALLEGLLLVDVLSGEGARARHVAPAAGKANARRRARARSPPALAPVRRALTDAVADAAPGPPRGAVKIMPKETMLRLVPPSCDIVCTHPMFGPESGKNGWRDLPFVYDAVRVADRHRFCRFLSLWEEQVRRCERQGVGAALGLAHARSAHARSARHRCREPEPRALTSHTLARRARHGFVLHVTGLQDDQPLVRGARPARGRLAIRNAPDGARARQARAQEHPDQHQGL